MPSILDERATTAAFMLVLLVPAIVSALQSLPVYLLLSFSGALKGTLKSQLQCKHTKPKPRP